MSNIIKVKEYLEEINGKLDGNCEVDLRNRNAINKLLSNNLLENIFDFFQKWEKEGKNGTPLSTNPCVRRIKHELDEKFGGLSYSLVNGIMVGQEVDVEDEEEVNTVWLLIKIVEKDMRSFEPRQLEELFKLMKENPKIADLVVGAAYSEFYCNQVSKDKLKSLIDAVNVEKYLE